MSETIDMDEMTWDSAQEKKYQIVADMEKLNGIVRVLVWDTKTDEMVLATKTERGVANVKRRGNPSFEYVSYENNEGEKFVPEDPATFEADTMRDWLQNDYYAADLSDPSNIKIHWYDGGGFDSDKTWFEVDW